MPCGYVYILGSETGTLYTGVTSDLYVRVMQHRGGVKFGFATKYGCKRLLFKQEFVDIRNAIDREKQIKGWTRAKKLDLIRLENSEFKDLAEQYGWLMIGPHQSIEEESLKLKSRYKLDRDSSRPKDGHSE